MAFIWKYLKNYKKLLLAVLLLAAVNQIFSLLDPQVFRLLVDNYGSKARELEPIFFLRGVGWLLLAFVGVALVSRLAKNFQDYYVNVITHRLGTKLYADSISHSLSLPYQIFEDQRSGEILDKLQKARTDSQRLITGLINVMFVYILGILFVIIYAFGVNWLIGLSYTLIIPTLGSIIFLISRRIKDVQQKIVSEQAALAGNTTETLRNVELVKSLGLEEQEIKRLNLVNEDILKLELQRVRLVRTLGFIQGTMINLLRAGIMFLMLWLIYEQKISLGEFFTLLFYSFFLFTPLAELSQVAEQYQAAKASTGQLRQIMSWEPEKKISTEFLLSSIDAIELKNISFYYKDKTKPAVDQINITIKSGQSLALVGPSGSGKSTIIKLLVRLYEPSQGRLIINGSVDSNKIDLAQYRRQIGLVSQETQLFSGTIKENLLFVSPRATETECLQALRDAALDNLLERSLQGIDTKIGEGGLKLSGGEKQRLAIARALLRQPKVLIFDEATSSLDSLTEKQITHTIKNIETNHRQLITVLVAHRLSTIAHAQNICVLEKGRIIERGNHNSLLQQGGLYAALWREQIAVNNNE